MRLVLSTRNEHKLRELSELMRPYELDPLPDDVQLPPETGTTFADNALGKARAAAAATGRPAIADDSGIEAAALGGAPGVRSARYAGEDATDEENLAEAAATRCPTTATARGLRVRARVRRAGRAARRSCTGAARARSPTEPRGTGGFGYDPAFVPDDYPGDSRTMAELTPREKDAISHRGRAARALVLRLLEAEEAERPGSPLRSLSAVAAPAAGSGAGERDRRRTRARSAPPRANVAAAVFLVAIKLVTGLVTGSLAFIAEAAHSATDLVAALLTLFAVRVAVRPPDREHHYGHGKAEHLAALGESAFLMLVSLFIAYESIDRLTSGGGHHVDVTWWAFAVLGVVIVVDASRAIASLRASRRTGSAALAANAVHFASDLAGSLAVLVGLLFVRAGHQGADAVAALFVAVLVVIAAVRLAMASIDVLMDRAVADADERIRAALAQADEEVEVRRVRVRQAGGRNFVDLVVAVPLDTGRAAGAHGRGQHRGRGGARARRRRRGRACGADGGGGRHPRARHRRGGRDPRGARGAQRARDEAARRLRAVAAREAAARAVARPGARRGRAAGGARARRGAGAAHRAHAHRAAVAHRLGEHAAERRHRHRARGDRVGREALHRAPTRST